MSKTALKKSIADEQEGLDAITGESLPKRTELVDTDRIKPKAEGGTYVERDNVRVLNPRSHMKHHGTLREREESLEEIKSIFDDRVQMMRLLLKIDNQLMAYKRRTDHPHPDTVEFLGDQLKPIKARLGAIDRALSKAILAYPDPLSQAALGVKGLGPISVTALAVYVDLAKAATPSALWKYVGLHCASHERYTKGKAGGGNKTLRTVLYTTACVMIKLGEGPYRDVYDRTKERLANSEKIVKSRNTEGKLIETAWKDTKPCHRHGAALRAIIKHLLADYWLVGRTLAGLPTPHLYAEAQLGHTHIVNPRERGWQF